MSCFWDYVSPEDWRLVPGGEREYTDESPYFPGEKAVEVVVGTFQDDYLVSEDIVWLVPLAVYEKVRSGQYAFDRQNLSPKGYRRDPVIRDENGKVVVFHPTHEQYRDE